MSKELIAEARAAEDWSRFPARKTAELIYGLRTALEVAEARATEAEALAQKANLSIIDLVRMGNERADERDAALAVIEKAKAHEWSCWGDSDTHRILSSVPVDVLRERDAEKWDEGEKAARQGRPVPNPYRSTEGGNQ